MKEIYAKAKKIKLAIFDVDGVFTDGKLYYTAEGEVTLGFYIHDGLGIELLHRAGIETAIISGRKSSALEKRATQLNIKHLYLGYNQKAVAYKELRQKLQLTDEQIAYTGDDWIDIPAMQLAGFKVAVANAVPEIKKLADWETAYKGGKGAVREVCELIMRAQDKYDSLLNAFFQDSTS